MRSWTTEKQQQVQTHLVHPLGAVVWCWDRSVFWVVLHREEREHDYNYTEAQVVS